jgi:hypothetical protein
MSGDGMLCWFCFTIVVKSHSFLLQLPTVDSGIYLAFHYARWRGPLRKPFMVVLRWH